MSNRLVVRDRAVDELQVAFDWYENEVPGLGDEFLVTVDEFINHILSHPSQFKVSYRKFREIFIQKFPFVIVYFIDKPKRTIVIFSVFHTSRNPKLKYK